MIKYSVLMSLYERDKPEFLRVALDSMLEQSIPPDEIVLVEDGPLTDALYEVIEQYKSKCGQQLHIVVFGENHGLGNALNKGLIECRNEFVARMDSDDISVSNRCELQLNYFRQHPEVSIVGGQIEEFIGDENHPIGKRTVPLTNAEIMKYMKHRCPLNHVSVMFRKSHVLAAGNYQECFWNEDTYLWIRMALNQHLFANLSNVLVHVRVGEEMYQRRGGIRYFRSEEKLQRLMLNKRMISIIRYCVNVFERLIVQMLMPNRLRGWVFRKLARENCAEVS